MTKPANFSPRMLHPGQVSEPKEPSEPWLRQPNEPAVAHMHFRIYLDLGTRRSLRKAVAIDRGLDPAIIGDKGLREIKIPGSWQRASKVWNWKERAHSFDLSELEKHSKLFQKIASSLPFCSRSYRVCQLHSMAVTLEKLLCSDNMPIKTYLALAARLQSVMRDLSNELSGLDTESRYADEVGLATLIKSDRMHVDGLSMDDWLKNSHTRYRNEFPHER